ncbi:MAG: hypothetical protein ABWY17_07240 [Pseudomonas sp.]
MWLNESENELRRDLQSVASDLRWSAVELLRIAEQLRLAGTDVDAHAALRLCDLFQGDEQRLAGYAEEVKAKAISRKPHDPPENDKPRRTGA